jgi:hypothetical protein
MNYMAMTALFAFASASILIGDLFPSICSFMTLLPIRLLLLLLLLLLHHHLLTVITKIFLETFLLLEFFSIFSK